MARATHYIVQTAAAKMPQSCKGNYGKIGLLRVDADLDRVSMISERAKGCHEVIMVWDRLHVGGPRSAFRLALEEAQDRAMLLNLGEEY